MKSDFDLEDIRENLDDGFSGFGFGMAARRAGTRYIAEPRGLGKFDKTFNPSLKDL